MHNMWWFVFYAAVVNNEITDRCLQAGSSSVLIAFTAFIAPLRFFNTRHAIKFSPPYHRRLKPVCSCEMKSRSIFSWTMSLSLLRLLFKQIRFSNISLCADATHASCVCSVAFLSFSLVQLFPPLSAPFVDWLMWMVWGRDLFGALPRFTDVECFRIEFNWLLCKHDFAFFFRVNFHWIFAKHNICEANQQLDDVNPKWFLTRSTTSSSWWMSHSTYLFVREWRVAVKEWHLKMALERWLTFREQMRFVSAPIWNMAWEAYIRWVFSS